MARSSPGYPQQSRMQLPGRDTRIPRSSCKAPALCTSSAHPVSPQQDTEVWEKRREMFRDKSYSWGWSLFHSSSPSTRSLRVSCCWQQRDKRLQLWDILTPSEPGHS